MRSASLLPVLFVASALAAQEELKIPPVKIPVLPAHAASAQAFAPAGWAVQLQAKGDLNADGTPDLAFVLHDTDKRNVLKDGAGVNADGIDTNPRILGIAFADKAGGYTLAAQNSTLIPRWESPTQEDNFDEEGAELTIARGALNVGMHYFSNAGGWDTGTNTFTFRWQNVRFELIGYENENTNRASLDETSTSVNYSTGIAVRVVSNDNSNKSKPRRITLPKRPLKTLSNVGDGMMFEIPGDS